MLAFSERIFSTSFKSRVGSADGLNVDAGKPLTILYAEDDSVSSKILGRTLQSLGYEAHGFVNGQEALEWFIVHQPPIIISDWMMPVLDGLGFCAKVRELNLPHYTYFVILTANAGASNYRKAMDSGVDDFLAKPFRRDDLYIRLRVAERIVRQREESDAKIQSLARFPADNPNPVLQADRAGRIVYANQASVELLKEWNAPVGEPLPPPLQHLLESRLLSGQNRESEMSCSDRVFAFATTSMSVGGDVYLYGHDITARKKAEAELIAMRNQAVALSLQDALTGIGNRVLFEQRLPEMLDAVRKNGRKLALLLIDIDNFKEINDSYGHKVGDQVIIHVGHTLQDRLKAKDCVCRWGGDEMVVMITDLPERQMMRSICERLMDAIKRCAIDSDLPTNITLSIGFAVYPDDSESAETLMQKADFALYQAKADGRDCWREYKEEYHAIKSSQNLFQRLNTAIQENRLTAHFQPVWDAVSGKVAGVEALARWSDPDLGFVPPDQFIPLAENKGLIISLSQQVLSCSLRTMASWVKRGFDLSLSVNLSKRQLLEPNFITELRRQVDEAGLSHRRIIFEVTERQSILGHAIGRQRIQEMSAMGFRLSLDDFGSGYSSFDLVSELPFDELKIYSGLIKKMQTPRGKRIVQAIVEMGQTLNLSVVAEGVEQEEEVKTLQNMGIHKIQGYYYSKPLAEEALFEYLEKQRATVESLPRVTTLADSTKISF